MTWIPPYSTDISRSRLDESFGGMGMKDGLTHIGLQFWRPTQEGQIELVDNFKPIDDSTIISFRKWGNVHNVRVLLCIYNGTREGWNWSLAKNAFDSQSLLSLYQYYCSRKKCLTCAVGNKLLEE